MYIYFVASPYDLSKPGNPEQPQPVNILMGGPMEDFMNLDIMEIKHIAESYIDKLRTEDEKETVSVDDNSSDTSS